MRKRSPSPTDTFQLVSCGFGLRNVTDTDLGESSEMVRVTRPGGPRGDSRVLAPHRPASSGRSTAGISRRVLPRVGQLFSKSPESAYNYLPASVMAFPDGQELADKLAGHGLTGVTFTPLTFGVATLYVGTRPD